MVRRRDGDRVDIFLRQQLAQVDVGADIAAVDRRFYLGEHGGIGVAQRHHPDAWHLGEAGEVAATAAVDADHGHADFTVGTGYLRPRAGRERGGTGQQRSGLQKRAAIEGRKFAAGEQGHGLGDWG